MARIFAVLFSHCALWTNQGVSGKVWLHASVGAGDFDALTCATGVGTAVLKMTVLFYSASFVMKRLPSLSLPR